MKHTNSNPGIDKLNSLENNYFDASTPNINQRNLLKERLITSGKGQNP
jgi:hypothetical protein